MDERWKASAFGCSGVSGKIRTRGQLVPAGLNITESYIHVLHEPYSYLFSSKEIWKFQQRIAIAMKKNQGVDRHYKSVHGFPIGDRTNVSKSVNFLWLFKVP